MYAFHDLASTPHGKMSDNEYVYVPKPRRTSPLGNMV